VPTQVAGRIHGSDGQRERDIAVAVNGRIAAVGRSFHLRGESVESYSVMVPEDSMHEGRNKVEVFEVTDGGAMVLLAGS
jgi:sulfur carrier protein ThiS